MAVNDSATTSLCLYCKAPSVAESGQEFHEIFNEVGIELQLPNLVETFFHIKLKNKAGQVLCDDCLNRLIELYDLAEHAKQANDEEVFLNIKEGGNKKHSNKEVEELQENLKEHNLCSLKKEDKRNLLHNVNHELECETGNQNSLEEDRDILDVLVQKETNTYVDDHIIEEDVDYNSETEKTNSNTILGTEILTEEFDVFEISQKESSSEITVSLDDEIQEQNVCKEKTLDDDLEEFVLEDHLEDTDEECEIQERFHSIQDNVNELVSETKLLKQADENILDVESDTLSSTTSNNEINCTEEEYLIEEIDCTEEYDCIDLNEYLDKAITTKFKDLELNWELKCKLCLVKYISFQDLLSHACVIEIMEDMQCCCIVEGCEENLNDLNSLARHLILQHYDKLEDIPIYGRCPDCQRTFSHIIEFNRHSCCRNIKRKAGALNYCTLCNLNFQSLRRYVFHMQFHLTNHRPKICLLCGSLFNNSNEFFDHIQYEHKPQGSLACTKCDRFFKEKEVYESHMELHEESKYKYACSYCPKEYTNKCGINLHMDVYHNHKRKPFQCEYCDKEFVNSNSYRNHIKTHIPDAQVESFVCSVCGLITKNLDIMKDHVEQDKDSSCFSAAVKKEILSLGYTCENCSLDFYTIKHLKEHRLSSNHNDKIFYCVICRRKFISLRHMRSHATSHKEFEKCQEEFPITKYYVCNIDDCEEFYLLWSSLYYHKQRRHKKKADLKTNNDFKCQFCQQLCTSKMSLAIHVARSHNNSNIRCTQCGQTYKSQKQLQEHVDKFHVEVKCEFCFKKFKNRRNLNVHNQSVHLNEKRYFCQHCNKGYFFKSEKDAHEKQVHSEISYRCELCNFVTNYPKSLEIHLDKHSNQLKFKCTICTKAFGRKQLLTEHIKRHEGKKGYKCQEYFGDNNCDAVFFTYNLLKTHIQKDHKDPKAAGKVVLKRKKVTKYLNQIQIDGNVNEDEDINDSAYGKRHKSNFNNELDKDEKSESDSIEIIVENELLADDNEFILQYKDDIANSSD